MTSGKLEESQTTFIKELLTENKVVGKERDPSRTDLLTTRKFDTPLGEEEHSQFYWIH
jgi:hypothetical protein